MLMIKRERFYNSEECIQVTFFHVGGYTLSGKLDVIEENGLHF